MALVLKPIKLLKLDKINILTVFFQNRYTEIGGFFQEILKSTTTKPKKEKVDRKFVIFSESMDDKSDVAELLFSTRKPLLRFIGKQSTSGEAEMELKICGEKNRGNQKFKIQTLYEPENSNPRQYGQFLADCLREQDKTTFLFIIDPFSKLNHQEKEVAKIKNIAQILSTFKYDLFQSAIIVFLHDDKPDVSSKGSPEQILRHILGEKPDAFDGKLLDLVRQRNLIFIKRLDTKEVDKNAKIRELIGIILSKQARERSRVNDRSAHKISDGQISSTAKQKEIEDLVNILRPSTNLKFRLFSPSKEKHIIEPHRKLDDIWKSSAGEMERDIEYSYILIKIHHPLNIDVRTNHPGVENGVHGTNPENCLGQSRAEGDTATTNTNSDASHQPGAEGDIAINNTSSNASQQPGAEGSITKTDGKTSQFMHIKGYYYY